MFKMSREKLEATLKQLDQAMYNHEQWYKELIRSIVCQLTYAEREMDEESHRHCRFGQWYYNVLSEELHNHPSYITIESEHKLMHSLARKLLVYSKNKEPIPTSDYDNFSNTLERLRLNINFFKLEF